MNFSTCGKLFKSICGFTVTLKRPDVYHRRTTYLLDRISSNSIRPGSLRGTRSHSQQARPRAVWQPGRGRRKWPRYLAIALGLVAASPFSLAGYNYVHYTSRGMELRYLPYLPGLKQKLIYFMFPMGMYRGVAIHVSFLDNIEKAQTFHVRPDDIFVVSFPRSGTTWTQEMVYLIVNDGDLKKATSEILEKRFPYFECNNHDVNRLTSMQSPRLIKSHLPYHILPPEIQTVKPKSYHDEATWHHPAKLGSCCFKEIIYVMRNPKDVLVSVYHQVRQIQPPFLGDFNMCLDLFLDNNVFCSPWADHVKGFWEKRTDDSVLFLKYEDMLKDVEGTVRKLAGFLRKSLTDEQVKSIVNHCSFESMRSNNTVNYSWWDESGKTKNMGNTFIRKGKVEGWKDYFSSEQSARMNKMAEESLKGSDLTVEYEPASR